MARALLIGTFETKGEALAYMETALVRQGLGVTRVDVSLGARGVILSGAEKIAAMSRQAEAAARQIATGCGDCSVAVGLGGGTGGEIVLAAIKGLPSVFPKLMVTTMAFDPREAVADTAITLIPTLCDIEGLNRPLRQVLENTAVMAAGLAEARQVGAEGRPTVAVTSLGATARAGKEIGLALGRAGLEATFFHANGYGGAAFARFVAEGHAQAVIDMTTHELGRMRIAGAHAPMPGRFAMADGLPRVVMPGGLNFLGLGPLETVPRAHLERPHYRHSSQFTHAKLTGPEMADQAAALARALNAARAPVRVMLPMGGFSHEDREGGAIHGPELREIAAQVLEAEARAYRVERLPHHINTPEAAQAAVAALNTLWKDATHDLRSV